MNVAQVAQQSTQQAHFQPIQGAFAPQHQPMNLAAFAAQQQQVAVNPGQQLQFAAGAAPIAVSGAAAAQISDDGSFIIPPFDAAMDGQVTVAAGQQVVQQQQQQLIQGTQDGAGKILRTWSWLCCQARGKEGASTLYCIFIKMRHVIVRSLNYC